MNRPVYLDFCSILEVGWLVSFSSFAVSRPTGGLEKIIDIMYLTISLCFMRMHDE